MKLQAWRTIDKNPGGEHADQVPVKISIGPVKKEAGVWPWVLDLDAAIKIFGQEQVDRITKEPVRVKLEMKVK